MTADIENILADAVAIESAEERVGFLDRVCGNRPEIRREVDRLVRLHLEAGNFLDQWPQLTATLPVDDAADRVGTDIGHYRLLEKIGEGGMGVVYMASQHKPLRRTVALKIIKPGMDSQQVIARFQAERQALALMNHPHIAKVLDAGATESGSPYFVMELVRGVPITTFCDRHKLDLRQRLELFVKVCGAVQHAHQKGVIHRDLKPTNILVELEDVRAVPKVIDFGVAKATNQSLTTDTLHTGFCQLIGTPMYMSPEQAQLSSLDVDTRSDVYSLGVLLYELITGTTPFDKETLQEAGLDELRRMIREVDPARPSDRITTLGAAMQSTLAERLDIEQGRLRRALRGELDWIVMKTLEKDRNRRYDSASGLADDVQRYLDDEPVEACPPSLSYRLRKFSRRYRSYVAVASLMAAALVLGLASTSWQAVRAARAEGHLRGERDKLQIQEQQALAERDRAQGNQRQAQLNQYYAEIVSGQADWQRGYLHRLHDKLLRHLPLPGEPDRRGWEWYFLMSRCRPEEAALRASGRNLFATWSPDGEFIAAGGNIWRADSLEQVRQFWPGNTLDYRGAWSPDAQTYAWGCAGDDGVFIWDRSTDALSRFRGHTSSVWVVQWSPDGKRLASAGLDRTIKVWDAQSQKILCSMDVDNNTRDLAWSPDGKLLASGVDYNGLIVWNADTGEAVFKHKKSVSQVSWHPDGSRVALCAPHGWSLIRCEDWQVEREEGCEHGRGQDIAWSPDGKTFAVSDGELVAIWDPKSPQPQRTLQGHLRPVIHLSWSPDGRRLVTSDGQEDMRIWDLASELETAPRTAGAPLSSLAFAADQETLLAVERTSGKLLSLKRGQQAEVLSEPPRQGAQTWWSPDQNFVAVCHDLEVPEVVIRNRAGEIHARWQGEPGSKIGGLAWSPDADKLAISQELSGSRGCIDVWSVHEEKRVSRWHHTSVAAEWRKFVGALIAWSQDGTKFAVNGMGEASDIGGTSWQGHVYVVDAKEGATLLKHNLGRANHGAQVTALAWAPDGQAFVAGSREGLTEAVELATTKSHFSSRLFSTEIRSLAWSPDGRRIASAAQDGSVRVLAAGAGDDLLAFDLDSDAEHVAWSRDGSCLAAASVDGEVHVWSATQAYKLWNPRGRNSELAWAHFLMSRTESGEARQVRLREVVARAPDNLAHWMLRGYALAVLGKFEQAAEEFAKGNTPGAVGTMLQAQNQAYAQLAMGNIEMFSRQCAPVIRALTQERVPANGMEAARMVTYVPDGATRPMDSKAALKLARTYRESQPAGIDNRDKMTLGACLYRAAQYEEAASVLQEVIEAMERSPDPLARADFAQALYFMAMTRQKLHHSFQARRYLDDAARVAGEIEQTNWKGRAVVAALDREARKMIAP